MDDLLGVIRAVALVLLGAGLGGLITWACWASWRLVKPRRRDA